MAKTCEICGKRAYSDRCVAHKPRKPILSRSKPLQTSKTVSKSSKPRKPTKKPVKRSKVVKDLDNIYSQYIRLKESDKYGYCICVTSGQKMFWTEAQNGHFISRAKYPTRWDDMNCHPQSVYSNIFLRGDYINYTIYMIDRYGRRAVDGLIKKSTQQVKIPTSELLDKIAYYKTEVAKIRAEKGL